MFTRTIEGRAYYAYSFHRTFAEASDALDEYFANGEICNAERPEIITTTDHKLHGSKALHAVMFPM